jgi:hypothetical protein
MQNNEVLGNNSSLTQCRSYITHAGALKYMKNKSVGLHRTN